MNVTTTALSGVLAIEPMRFSDVRGIFSEFYRAERYAAAGITGPFVQDNFSRSARGVLRGLHLQHPNSQGKLVGALSGCIFDVMVDVRHGSPTFGRHVAMELSGDNGRQLFAPRGFAHGFVVLSEQAEVFYKCDSAYSPADEIVLAWDDPALGIDWPVKHPQLSPRDAAGVPLAAVAQLPAYEP
jgi:dTDP-4-dehydrorhamnose 3,5-epimerase